MGKYENKYRVESARLKNWDYGSNSAYFITICTENRLHCFGEIIPIHKLKMQLNDIGKLAEQFWREIPVHFPFIKLGEFVVMPNHIHGILIIDKMDDVETLQCKQPVETLQCKQPIETLHCKQPLETLQCNVSTENPNEQMSAISPKSGSISTIIRSYKSAVTKNAHLINAGFEWQTRFYDHIIRNAESYSMIENYIVNNPDKWIEDTFNG